MRVNWSVREHVGGVTVLLSMGTIKCKIKCKLSQNGRRWVSGKVTGICLIDPIRFCNLHPTTIYLPEQCPQHTHQELAQQHQQTWIYEVFHLGWSSQIPHATSSYDKAMAVTHSLHEEAFIGICELPAHTEESLPLAFGVQNACPIDRTGLNGIIESIIDDNGPSRLRLDMPVTLMIRKPWVASSDWPRMITPDNYGGLPTLELTDVGRQAANAGRLQLLNGQHRYVSSPISELVWIITFDCRITALRAAYEAVKKDVNKYEEATKGKSISDLTTLEDKL